MVVVEGLEGGFGEGVKAVGEEENGFDVVLVFLFRQSLEG